VTDEELVALARQGDTAAFAALVVRHQAAVYRAALAAVRIPADAEDVAAGRVRQGVVEAGSVPRRGNVQDVGTGHCLEPRDQPAPPTGRMVAQGVAAR
jgi:hypothetical protein